KPPQKRTPPRWQPTGRERRPNYTCTMKRTKRKAVEGSCSMIANSEWMRRLPRKMTLVVALVAAILMLAGGTALAQEAAEKLDASAAPDASENWQFYLIWAIAFIGSIVALVQAWV